MSLTIKGTLDARSMNCCSSAYVYVYGARKNREGDRWVEGSKPAAKCFRIPETGFFDAQTGPHPFEVALKLDEVHRVDVKMPDECLLTWEVE